MRLGLYNAAEDATSVTLRDWARTGIEFRRNKTGPGQTPGFLVCTCPGVAAYADLAARTDLLLIGGARMWVYDSGTWGSEWIVVNGAWVPNGPIRGNGTPEAAVTAPVGSLYQRLNGGAVTTLYVKETGTGNTGWVAK